MRKGPESLAELQRLVARCPAARRSLMLECCETYEEFVDLVYGELDDVFRMLESNKQLYKEHGEDALTNFIVTHLLRAGFGAEQGAQRGGSVDILVKHSIELWSWVGEAKIYKDVGDMRQGFLQLATRYTIQSNGQPQGGVIGYLKDPEPDAKLRAWYESLIAVEKIETASTYSPIPRSDRHVFFSTHYHNGLGLSLKVRHTLVSLYHRPLDASGLTAAKYQGMPTTAVRGAAAAE